MEHISVVIIGAGWSGLTVAKTYIQAHPDVEIAVLEAADSVGGVWASHRIYPGLRTNSILGSYENPDFPMNGENYGVKPGEHIPGAVVHQYMTDFAKTFDIWPRIRFCTEVEEIHQALNGQWILTLNTSQSTNGKETTGTKEISVDKLIIATGVTGNPNMPVIPGAVEFNAPFFHAKDFLQQKELLKTAKKVVVYGGSKSAWDAVYAYSTSGIQVEWVIRESGGGPCWMSPILVTPLKKTPRSNTATDLLHPTLLGNGDGYDFWRRLLHGTAIGRWFVGKFWGVLESDVVQLQGFDADPEVKKLKPWFSAFWSGPSLSITNYPTDFFQYVKNGTARIHYAEITHLTPHTVHLSTGEALEVDALHCSTGWKHEPPIEISPPSLAAKLGLPTDLENYRTELTQKADAEILSRFPRLRDQPKVASRKQTLDTKPVEHRKSPYRLYKYMIPPATAHSRNFAIAGALLVIGTATAAQMQALWITSYLDGSLALPKSSEGIEYATELSIRFGHWRYPADYGDRHAALAFDSLPYFDELLKDLGVRSRRKEGWWKELLEDYRPADYRGVVEEWMELRGRDGKKVR